MSTTRDRLRFLWDLGGSGPIYSLLHLVDEFTNRQNAWDVEVNEKSIFGSLSNTTSYVTVCEKAGTEDKYFNIFRSCTSYRKILEHVSPRMGQRYLKILKKDGRPIKTLQSLLPLLNNGGPATYKFKKLGRISPTSIRYAKVHQDLNNLFGELDGFRITEIGCGYGGMAVQILAGEKIKSYFVVDLPQVEKLAFRYVNSVLKNSKKLGGSCSNEINWDTDLLISNYAFSELDRELQDAYLRKYLINSKRGYMIYNHINPDHFNSYTAKEITNLIPGSEIFDEVPLTDVRNVLIVWGHLSK